jgi:hypothetical protein
MEGLNDVNLKRGIGNSYSRLKTKVQKCAVDMMVMKEENEQLKKFKEEITLKQLEMERHVIAQQQMYTQMQMELECSKAKTSDLENKFNLKVASNLSQCDPSRRKYERKFLPSDMTCRRNMKRVYNQAQNIGFALFPSEQKGCVWCWGDEDDNFTTVVSRYIYDI